jgi:dienelactone hydrolase
VIDRFPVDRFTIDARQRREIDAVAARIVASQRSVLPIVAVCLVGHADETGTDQHNLVLGGNRASAVERELRTAIDRRRAGLAARLAFRPSSVGESQPLEPNTTPEGRARNRSVEILLGCGQPNACLRPPVAADDPTSLCLFPVGTRDFDAGTVTVEGRTVPLKGTVFYPGDRAGANAPFARSFRGRAPVVVLAHGNHGLFFDPTNRRVEDCDDLGCFLPIPNHKGYDYLQELYARMGMVAISVDCGPTNCEGLSPTNIRERAGMIVQSLVHFELLNRTDPTFRDHLDFTRVGLLGHSRGGEAVLVAAETLAAPSPPVAATVRGVVSVAPTDDGTSSGTPTGFAFMAVLPAADGDVSTNDGAKFYDRAVPSPFKAQLYIHGGCHNFFNRQWEVNEGRGPALLCRAEQERILAAYSCAFYRQVLLAQAQIKFLRVDELPPGVRNDVVHVSIEQSGVVTVDDHENRNVAVNTLGQATAQTGGLTADEFDFSQAGQRRFNATFFGNTVGLVARTTAVTGRFRSSLGSPRDLTNREIWVRAAEVYNGTSVPAGATGYRLGLEDGGNRVAFVDSDDAGGLPRPYDRRSFDVATGRADRTKTILKTQRFPAACFEAPPGFDIRDVRAIVLQLDRNDRRAIALDQLQIV